MPEPNQPGRRETTRTLVRREDRRRLDQLRTYLAIAGTLCVVLGAVYMVWAKIDGAGSAEEVRRNARQLQATREDVAELKGALAAQSRKVETVLIEQGKAQVLQQQVATDVTEIKQALRDLAKGK